MNGVAVTRSVDPNAVDLWFVYKGCWQAPRRFSVGEPAVEKADASLDHKLRDVVSAFEWKTLPPRQRQENLALLARWFYSSWREDGWLSFEDPAKLPYRKLVRLVSKAAATSSKPT